MVLHLFFSTGPATFFTRTEDHREVCQVLLDPSHPSLAEAPLQRQAEAHLGRCSYVLTELPKDTVLDILEAAAQFRLVRKAHQIHTTADIHGENQALFQGIAEALGYRKIVFPCVC